MRFGGCIHTDNHVPMELFAAKMILRIHISDEDPHRFYEAAIQSDSHGWRPRKSSVPKGMAFHMVMGDNTTTHTHTHTLIEQKQKAAISGGKTSKRENNSYASSY